MTAEEKQKRAMAVACMYQLYLKYYPKLKNEIKEYCKQKCQVENYSPILEGVPIDFKIIK